MDGRTFLSIFLLYMFWICFENKCIIYEFVFHKPPNQPHSLCLMSLSNLHTNTHAHYPLRACGEERKDKLHPNICFAYLPWPVCMCIFEEVWARGIHQYVSTVVALSVSVETLPDVIQISTFLRLEVSLTSCPELCLSKWFKSRGICLIQIFTSIVYFLFNGTHIIRDREISCSTYRKAILLYAIACCFEMCL